MSKYIDSRSKKLAFLLRHDTDGWKLGKIDSEGWRNIQELFEDYGYSKKELKAIIESDSKGRYEFSGDGLYVRACQGHSIPVDVDSIQEKEPPEVLYHGTSEKSISLIMEKGILKWSRLYVHLSSDIETAKNVGARHKGDTVVLRINSGQMFKDGYKFLLSSNGVWLTDYVDPKYIKLCKGCEDDCKWSEGKEEYELGEWGIFCNHPENLDYVDKLKICSLYESKC